MLGLVDYTAIFTSENTQEALWLFWRCYGSKEDVHQVLQNKCPCAARQLVRRTNKEKEAGSQAGIVLFKVAQTSAPLQSCNFPHSKTHTVTNNKENILESR